MIKEILAKIFHLVFSRATVVISNIILFIICSRYFTLEDYATIRQTFLPFEVLVPILTLGIPTTIYYLLPRREDTMTLIKHSFFLIYLAFSICILLLLFYGLDEIPAFFNNSQLSKTLKWVLIYSLFQLPINLLVPVYIYNGKTRMLGWFSSIQGIILLVIGVSLVLLGNSYESVIILKAVLPIPTLFGLFICARKFLKNEKNSGFTIIQSFSNILKVSIPFGLASVIGSLSMQIDKLIVSNLGSSNEFAIYVNGAIEIPLIGIVTGSIASILISDLSIKIKEGNLAEALKLFKITSNKTALILFPLMVFFLIMSEEFMVILYSEKYSLSSYPFLIYLLLLPIRIVVFGSIMVALNQNSAILFRSIIELIMNIILSYVMFLYFGYLGVALATVIINYFWSVPFNIKYISKGLKIKVLNLFDYKELTVIMIISILCAPLIFIGKLLEVNIYRFMTSFIFYSLLVLYLYQRIGYVDLNSILNRFKIKL